MNRDRSPRGQTLVVFALALTALLGMVGLVIDGGNAFAQQRRTQNAVDAAAEAGAVQLARRMVGLPGTDAEWDARVDEAVRAVATVNGVTTSMTPEYTDDTGAPLGPVGEGSIPPDTFGVHAAGDRNFSTFISGVLGLSAFTASAEATAITGYVTEVSGSSLIPLTLPLILTQCESGSGSNRLYHPLGNEEWPHGANNRVALPLCSNGPGNVGWIDWSPKGGGASELGAQIRNPTGPPVRVPKWYFVSQTGAITSTDDDMDTWEGKDILLPIFHVEADDPATPAIDESIIGTCDTDPSGDMTALSDCPAGHNGGTGTNQWYYLVTFGEFHLEAAFISENRETECNDPDLASTAGAGGARIKNCLIGYFNGPVVAGGVTVGGGPPVSEFSPIGVQLIR
jgi:hypothetical protein